MRVAALLLAIGCTQKTDLLPRANGDAGLANGPRSVGGECAGAAAAERLRYALCSCSALVVEHGLFTETNDMSMSAAVGTDENLQVAGLAQVSGGLQAAGSYGVSFGRSAEVTGTLRSGGAVSSIQFLNVDGDAFVDGDVLGRVDVAGKLHVPRGSIISTSVVAENGLVVEPVSVAAPCNCNAAPDFVSDLANHQKQNDNGAIQLSPDVLEGGSAVLDLPSGDFHLSGIKMPPDGALELRVHGFAAIYVDGDVMLGSGLRVILDPMAELDLVVGGDFTAPDGVVGAPDAGLVRLWLGSKTVSVGRFATLSASVYAPFAVVRTDGDLVVAGALLAAGLSVQGEVHVHYDGGILNAGASCGVMPQPPVP